MTTERVTLGIEVEDDVVGTDVATATTAADKALGVAPLDGKKEAEHENGHGDVEATEGITATANVTEKVPEVEERDFIKWFLIYEIIFEIIANVENEIESTERRQNAEAERIEALLGQPEDEPEDEPELNAENAQNNMAVAVAVDADELNDDAFIDDNMVINVAHNFEAAALAPIEEEDEAEGEGEAVFYTAPMSAANYCRCTVEKCRYNFKCNLCGNGVRNAVITICGHLFCWPCLWQYERVRLDQTNCPHCCRHIRLHEDVVPYYGGNDDDDQLIMNTIPNMVPRPSAFRFKAGANSNCWFFLDEAYRRAMYNYPRRRLEFAVSRLDTNERIARWCTCLRYIEIGIVVLLALLSLTFGDDLAEH